MSKIETIELFPVKVFRTTCEHHNHIKKYMMDNVYEKFLEHGPNDEFQQTYTDYVEGATFIHWPYLYKLYEPTIYKLLQEIGFRSVHSCKVSMTGWYNFTTHTTRQFIHDHMGGPSTIQFSAVHYVCLSKTSAGTIYHNPYTKFMKATTPTKNIDLIPKYFTNFNLCPTVNEGDIVIFPSWLDHCIPPHLDGSLRVTNALNICLRLDNSDGN